jgi:type II secretory pathway pseudopilin PulG
MKAALRMQGYTIRKLRGFTILELLVASTSFVVVFTGIAIFLQSSFLVGRHDMAIRQAVQNYQQGIRLVKHGNPILRFEGLDLAHTAKLASRAVSPEPATFAAEPWLEYETFNASYVLFLVAASQPVQYSGQFLLCKTAPPADAATYSVLGEPMIPRGPMEFPPRLVATWALEPWEVEIATPSLVRMPVRIFLDSNNNYNPDDEEPEVIFHPAFTLGNSP